jgi:diacylglycerol O-acyltransferase / trehalose O-mycolyltransferase
MSKLITAGAALALAVALAGCSSTGNLASTLASKAPGLASALASAAPALASGGILSRSASPAPSLATIGTAADDGARIVKVEELDTRTRDLTIESPVVGTVKTRLLLPSTFARDKTTRYPVLMLLHGGGGEYVDWTKNTDVKALTAPTDLLVAMPAAFTSQMLDRVNGTGAAGGTGGLDKWDVFHNTELLQLLERNWQAGDQRAIAGLSFGGFGTVNTVERHPDLYKALAAFSGGPLDLKSLVAMQADEKGLGPLGKAVLTEADWKVVDPVDLIGKLAGKALYFSYGTGQPGPLDPGRTDVDELEQVIGGGDQGFTAALKAAGIPATVHAYGPGTHSWPYWERELHAALPMLLEAVGGTASGPLPTPPPHPSASQSTSTSASPAP